MNEVIRCRSCGETFERGGSHICQGLRFEKPEPTVKKSEYDQAIKEHGVSNV